MENSARFEQVVTELQRSVQAHEKRFARSEKRMAAVRRYAPQVVAVPNLDTKKLWEWFLGTAEAVEFFEKCGAVTGDAGWNASLREELSTAMSELEQSRRAWEQLEHAFHGKLRLHLRQNRNHSTPPSMDAAAAEPWQAAVIWLNEVSEEEMQRADQVPARRPSRVVEAGLVNPHAERLFQVRVQNMVRGHFETWSNVVVEKKCRADALRERRFGEALRVCIQGWRNVVAEKERFVKKRQQKRALDFARRCIESWHELVWARRKRCEHMHIARQCIEIWMEFAARKKRNSCLVKRHLQMRALDFVRRCIECWKELLAHRQRCIQIWMSVVKQKRRLEMLRASTEHVDLQRLHDRLARDVVLQGALGGA